MAGFANLRPTFRRATTENVDAEVEMTTVQSHKQDPDARGAPLEIGEETASAEIQPDAVPSGDVQRGVQDVEGVTTTWSKATLIAVFLNIWLLYFVNAFQSSILSNLLPYVTSDYDTHSLLNVIYIVADAMTAAVYIPLSKVLDVWGRAEGFLIMTVFATLGLVLMATCSGLAHFCAAYTFYTIGFGGMTYCVDVITADASRLKNRGLAYAFTSSPYMITAFAGAKASEDVLNGIGWRWGFGIFSIIFPIVAAPLFFVLKFNLKKAREQGTLAAVKASQHARSSWQRVKYWVLEFDLFGVLIFSLGLVVFFLPFDIAASASNGWGTGYIIAMIVVGVVMLVCFIAYETYFAPVPLLNWRLLTNRTVIGACLLDATYQISYYCWANYFTSFLQVVNDLSVAEAGYVSHTFDVVSGVLLIMVGFAIRKTGRFKWLLYIAVPLYIFTQGLMIYFRRPNQSVGYLVMCQVFISVGGSIFIIVEQLAILAAVDHQHIASVLALLNVVGTVGDAMGATISGAIWTNTFLGALNRNLPSSAIDAVQDIYEDLETQLSYAVGTDARLAIQRSYGYAQTRMLAAGVGIMALALIWMLMIKNIDLRKVPQVKGMVF